MKRMYPRLPILFAGLGGAAFSLRLFLYIAATDEKGLLIPGHPLELLLWLLAAATTVLTVAALWKQMDNRPYADNFPGKIGSAVGCLVFAAGLGLTAAGSFPAFSLMEKLCGILGLLAVPALIALAFCRAFGKRPFFALHALVCLALTLHTVGHYRIWSSCPQLQDAFFPMMGCIGLMLFSYYQTAFDVDMGSRRMQLGTGLLAAFCCFAAMPGSHTTLLYLTGGFWTLTNLCALTPPVKNEKEDAQ